MALPSSLAGSHASTANSKRAKRGPPMLIPHGSCKLTDQEKCKALQLCPDSAGACTSGTQSAPKRAKRKPPVHAPCKSCKPPCWRKAQAISPLLVALQGRMPVAPIPTKGAIGGPLVRTPTCSEYREHSYQQPVGKGIAREQPQREHFSTS